MKKKDCADDNAFLIGLVLAGVFIGFVITSALFGLGVFGVSTQSGRVNTLPAQTAESMLGDASWECVHEKIVDWKFVDDTCPENYLCFGSSYYSAQEINDMGGICFKDQNMGDLYLVGTPEPPIKNSCVVYKLPIKECDKYQLVKYSGGTYWVS